jgi:hypothetical protein
MRTRSFRFGLVAFLLLASGVATANAFEPVRAFAFEVNVPTREVTGTITEIDRTNFLLTLDNGRVYQAFPNMVAILDVGLRVTIEHLLDTDLTVLEIRDASR